MRAWFGCPLAVLLVAASAARADGVKIVGEAKHKPHSLVRLRAEGADPKAALLWRVHPAATVQRATSPRGLLEFAAHPGSYEVELLVIAGGPEGLRVEEARLSVQIESCVPPSPPTPPTPPKPPRPDTVAALGKVRFGSAGCTATVVGPRRPDGRWDVLTAAHCVAGVGQRGSLTLPGGRTLGLQVASRQPGPDVAWCVTDEPAADMPHALLAEASPPPGTPVWHKGFGIDVPGNREEGVVTQSENPAGQLRMTLSVSSGDSGGGIFRADTDELVSAVCCTSGMARRVSMWGASTEAIRRSRPPATAGDEWSPVPIPIGGPAEADGDWQPLPIPICADPGPLAATGLGGDRGPSPILRRIAWRRG